MIKRVQIKNWKSLGNIDVHLDPVTVLIGRSGTGKSNFVEALRFLRDIVNNRAEGTANRAPYHGWKRLLSATSTLPITLTFTFTFDAPGVPGDYKYSLVFQQDSTAAQNTAQFYEPVLTEEKLVLETRVIFSHNNKLGKWQHPPAMVNPPPPQNVMLSALSGIPEITAAFLVLSKGLGCYSFLDTVLLEPKPDLTADEGLADDGGNFLRAYAAISNNLREWQSLKEMVAALRQLNPGVKAIDIVRPALSGIIVSHEVDARSLQFHLSQESGGFRRFLAHLIALYQSPPKQTLIFEEPEKGIHPGALATLVENFTACPEAGRGQVILTTHSPQLLDHFEPGQLRVVEMNNYVTSIGPVAAEQIEAIRENLLRTGELLTVDPARVQPVHAS